MKTAISIPDKIFTRAERFAKKRRMSRSSLYAVAVKEYMEHHKLDDITEQLNKTYSDEESTVDPVIDKIQMISLPEDEW